MKRPLLFLLLALICGCQNDPTELAPKIDVPQALLAEQGTPQQGAELFQAHCRECHGTPSEGRVQRATQFNLPAPDFLDPAYAQMDPAYLFWRISEGKRVEPFFSRGSVMPAFEPYFTDQQIWQLVAYLRQRAAGNSSI